MSSKFTRRRRAPCIKSSACFASAGSAPIFAKFPNFINIWAFFPTRFSDCSAKAVRFLWNSRNLRGGNDVRRYRCSVPSRSIRKAWRSTSCLFASQSSRSRISGNPGRRIVHARTSDDAASARTINVDTICQRAQSARRSSSPTPYSADFERAFRPLTLGSRRPRQERRDYMRPNQGRQKQHNSQNADAREAPTESDLRPNRSRIRQRFRGNNAARLIQDETSATSGPRASRLAILEPIVPSEGSIRESYRLLSVPYGAASECKQSQPLPQSRPA